MKNVGDTNAPYHTMHLITYVIKFFLFDLDHQRNNDMKRFYRKLFKSNKPSLGSTHGPGPATSTSTLLTNTTDFLPSIPAVDSGANTQVIAGVTGTVSVQLCSLLL